MIVTQNTKLNVVPGGIIPVVHVSQYDVDRAISFTLYDGNGAAVLDSGTTVSIEGTKPDGHGFQYAGTLTGNVASFNTTQQMTVLPGAIECKLTLTKDSQVIGTAMFILDVEKAGINEGTIISDTELPLIISVATEQMENAEAWAVGTKNGEPVSPTDPQYNNDAKHWAEEAAAAVSGVAGVKGNAEEEYRHGNVNLTPEDLGAVSWDDQSVLGAHNLVPCNAISKTLNGVTFTVNSDGTVVGSWSSTPTNTAQIIYSSEFHLVGGKEYKLSGCPSGGAWSSGNYKYIIYVFNNTDNVTVASDNGNGASFTAVSGKAYVVYIGIGTYAGSSGSLTFMPMIRLASDTDLAYAPYAMTNRELTELAQIKVLATANANQTWASQLASLNTVFSVLNQTQRLRTHLLYADVYLINANNTGIFGFTGEAIDPSGNLIEFAFRRVDNAYIARQLNFKTDGTFTSADISSDTNTSTLKLIMM